MKGFADVKQQAETEEMTIITEDIFKLNWMTTVRFNSFISFADEIDLRTFRSFIMMCLNMTKQGRSKLGMPSVCNAVLIAGNVPQDVMEFACQRPSKHTTMTEYPVVVDLAKHKTYYYTGPIFYGAIYARFEREYIDGHFAMPLRILSDKLLEGK